MNKTILTKYEFDALAPSEQRITVAKDVLELLKPSKKTEN